jgi:hypothetical protein
MTNAYSNIHGFDLTGWRPAKGVWLEFSQDCPQFAVSGSEQAFYKFVRTNKNELHAAGVVVRLSNGTWLGHPERFRKSIMAKLSGQFLPPLKLKPAARSRPAGKARAALPAQRPERAAA